MAPGERKVASFLFSLFLPPLFCRVSTEALISADSQERRLTEIPPQTESHQTIPSTTKSRLLFHMPFTCLYKWGIIADRGEISESEAAVPTSPG